MNSNTQENSLNEDLIPDPENSNKDSNYQSDSTNYKEPGVFRIDGAFGHLNNWVSHLHTRVTNTNFIIFLLWLLAFSYNHFCLNEVLVSHCPEYSDFVRLSNVIAFMSAYFIMAIIGLRNES